MIEWFGGPTLRRLMASITFPDGAANAAAAAAVGVVRNGAAT